MNTDLERQFRSSDERAQTRLALKDSTRKPSHPVRASEICMRASSTTDQNSSGHLSLVNPRLTRHLLPPLDGIRSTDPIPRRTDSTAWLR